MLSDDDAFLAAVAANPQDQLTRLVYADWLDERNDPRGELIRIEESVRFEPAWSDVLWSQKLRRNELRAKCDPAWLQAMRYGTDCLPLFYGRPFPDYWRDGWRLIREATERWLGHPMPDVGGHADEVEAVEKRLGLTLPPSVREFVAFAHDLHPVEEDAPWRVEPGPLHRLKSGYRMAKVPGHKALALFQPRHLLVGVPFEELGKNVPAAFLYPPDDPEGDGQYPKTTPDCRSNLTGFMFDYLFPIRYHRNEASLRVSDREVMFELLRKEFGMGVAMPDGTTVFEQRGLLVRLTRWRGDFHGSRLLATASPAFPVEMWPPQLRGMVAEQRFEA